MRHRLITTAGVLLALAGSAAAQGQGFKQPPPDGGFKQPSPGGVVAVPPAQPVPPPQSFDMVLTGRTAAGANANEELAIREAIGSLVAGLHVRLYVLRPTPPTGGFHICIEPNGPGGYNAIVGELSTYAVRESRWDITEVAGCL